MTGLTEALAELADAERACRDAEKRLSLPPWIYRKRVDAAMARWTAANLAVFDAQVAGVFDGDPSTLGTRESER
jgi:hypothetical protein